MTGIARIRPSLAFVDLETTGLSPGRHRILEIGIVTVDGDRVSEWTSLVNPGAHVPEFTRSCTGISDAMIADAPRFREIAPEIAARLRGRLFVAHNAHFDCGFLRSEFRRLAMEFDPRVLCTVRLSRKLYPQFARHDLDTLMQRHALTAGARHRALADAQLIWQFWQTVHEAFSTEAMARAMDAVLAVPALPPQLDPALIRALPESHGAYVLYGADREPLYVGKARNLRQGLLAHLGRTGTAGDALARRVHDIRCYQATGALGARLQAATLARALLPAARTRAKNAAALCTWRLAPESAARIVDLVGVEGCAAGSEDLFGLFTTGRKATNALRRLALAHRLCHSLLGLACVTRKAAPACQAAPCNGSCGRKESRRLHVARFISAAAPLKLKAWPYAGAIAIREGRDRHVVDQWRYLGTARTGADLSSLLETRRPAFDADVFKLLKHWLPACPRRLISELGNIAQPDAPWRADADASPLSEEGITADACAGYKMLHPAVEF